MDPIVLIHGMPLDASMWADQADFLRARGRTVFTPDLPGFGNAPALPRDRTSIEAYAAVVRDLIETQAGGRAIVGGFSMGGYVLFSLLRDAPHLVSAAMFFDTRPDPDTPEARKGRLDNISRIEREGLPGFFDASLARLMRKKPDPAVKARVRAIMDRQSPEGVIAGQLAMSRRRDQTDLLAELTIPVMVLVGAEDSITPPSVALNMQSHMPHAMVVQVVSAGHLAVMEQPVAVNGHLATFLATIHQAVPSRA
ncbi:MAG TPA: alpha/beta fold hydrolase [Phycisphaerae bacterium]|nr:alpha/beta fold hydrolase [Phycisphaerae bacterium]